MKNMEQKRPNILLITCDQLRYDFLSAYGCDFVKTPNIDRLAAEGCVYEHAYSPNPVCIPARHNLITGLPARYHGFDDNYFGASAKPCPYYLPTFAQILNDSGYDTIAIGKMHFQPERRATGFNYFYNMDELPAVREEDDYAMYLKKEGYGQLQSVHGVRTCLYMQPQRSLVPEKHHGSVWAADRTIEYLDSTRGRQPYDIWTGYLHPHPPRDLPEAWADLYRGKIPEPVKSVTPLSTLAVENQQLACVYNDEVRNRIRELYAAAISHVDQQIGRILDKLEELNLIDDTLILFVSDHGEMLGDLDTYQKFLPYDPSARIPFIIRYPKAYQAGERRPEFVDLNDVLPTFVDAAGLTYPADYELPGESLLKQDGKKDRRYQYIEHQRDNKRWCCIRDQRYKYVYYYGDREQMFDMVEDPKETVNLLWNTEDEEILKIRDELKRVLLSYESRWGLCGYVDENGFREMEPYEGIHYYEANYPIFPRFAMEEEKAQFDDYEDEILAAIKKEPVVKLSQNHTREILLECGYSEERIERLLERARAQGNG